MQNLARAIGEKLAQDLDRNELGQWSSLEVQHTVIWALKDLARRLRVLGFDMGRMLDLTDDMAALVGLPKALRCGHCGGTTGESAKFCQHCGKPLPSDPAAANG